MQNPVYGDNVTVAGDGTLPNPLHAIGSTGGPFDVPVFAPGLGSNSQILARIPITRNVTFPAGAANSFAKSSAAATGSTTFTFSKNGVQFASVNFGVGQTVGVFTQAANAVFVPGDVFELDGPAVADGTLANVGITLSGTRTA